MRNGYGEDCDRGCKPGFPHRRYGSTLALIWGALQID